MNGHASPPNPPLPSLSAPNKTLAPAQPTRRQSHLSSSSISSIHPSPLSPRFPSSDNVDSSSYSHTIKHTIASTTSLLRKPSDGGSIFSATQAAALKTLCSPVLLETEASNYWQSLLDGKYPTSTPSPQEAYDLELATVGMAIELAANNIRTRNWGKLLLHLLSQLEYVLANRPDTIPVQAYNSLFLTRVFSKHFAGNLTIDEIAQQFEDPPQEQTHLSPTTTSLDLSKLSISQDVKADTRPKSEQLLDDVLLLLINLDPNVNYATFEFYVELLNTMIVLLSTQLYHTRFTEPNYFLDILMQKFPERAEALVAKLLMNFTDQKTPPPQSSNVVYNAYNYFFSSRQNSASDVDTMPVADRSLLLLLLLAFQEPAQGKSPSAYRTALARLRDHNDIILSSNEGEITGKGHLTSFKDMYDLFCRSLGMEDRMLLFYLLLVENESFRVYVLSRTDPETIYVPLLKLVYETVDGKTNYAQIYILLTLLLVLSQDEVNNETIQKIVVNNLTWFTERPLLKSISLGGLVMLVLIRTLHHNLSHQKDIYIHTNCLSILANMASTVLDMHPYVAQRMISTLELISKRQQKVTKQVGNPAVDGNADTMDPATSSSIVSVYEDMLCLVLAIINAILIHRLKYNTQLVYVLLLKREIFAPLRQRPRLTELICNLEQVIDHFNMRVSEANIKAPSTQEILKLIGEAARTWSPSQLQMGLDFKFQYEEDRDAREFFVPYVWALMHRRSFVYWSEDKAHILSEYRAISSDGDDHNGEHH